jgi:putative PEP-CTERM system integral membrane protein
MKLSLSKIVSVVSYTTFWGWNVAFLILTLTGIMPIIGIGASIAVFNGRLPVDFLFFIWLLILIPIISIWTARSYLAGKPSLQIRFFYGVEVPIFMLCLLRLFLFRELTIATLFLIFSVLFATTIYARNLFYLLGNDLLLCKSNLFISSLLLIVALYIGALLSFYALPTGWVVLAFICSFEWLGIIFDLIRTAILTPTHIFIILFWTPLVFLLFYYSVVLFVSSPVAIVLFYGQTWLSSWRQQVKQTSLLTALGITGSVISVWLIMFILVGYQPQVKTFKVLDKPINTVKEQKKIIDQTQSIRQGLLNAYLFPYRYLTAKSEVNHIEKLYKDVFGLPDYITKPVQSFYNSILSPVLYKGERNDDTRAADLYASIFDTPIQKGEKKAILNALEATAYRDQAEAGLLNINQKKVLLAEQQISVKQSGGVANVEIYEVYENQTVELQEIFYYFSLPENAAVTGLWLGGSSDKHNRFSYVISPRGAAQKVYKEQVGVRVDPALLEQVGPRQYRLRAFPIPSRRISPLSNPFLSFLFLPKQEALSEQAKMHLWLTYSVINDGTNSIFPELLEKRNIYWSDKSKRILNTLGSYKTDAWMPNWSVNLPSTTNKFKAIFKEEGYLISARKAPLRLLKPTADIKIAVLIDTSYSMRRKKKRIADSLNWLQKNYPEVESNLFVVPFGDKQKESPQNISSQDVSKLTFFGFLSYDDLWDIACSLQAKKYYDSVFILSDQGSYELEGDEDFYEYEKNKFVFKELARSISPVWFVHLDRLTPAYKDDVMEELLLSKGGIAVTLKDAYEQFLIRKNISLNQRLHGRIVWDFSEFESERDLPNSASNLAIPAKMLIDYLASQESTLTLKSLDKIHQIAKRESVVTPYSSMIVLVNNEQKEQLKKAEAEKDRFNRAVDKGVEDLSNPSNPLVSAVPEPETWMLLILSLLFLTALVRRGRKEYLS